VLLSAGRRYLRTAGRPFADVGTSFQSPGRSPARMRSKNSSAAGRPKHAGSSRVIVGEGKTEVGLLRTYGDFWVHDHGASLAQKGISIVDGGGQNAAKRALDLASLGFPVLLVADSDVELKPSAATLRAAGVVVVQWAGTMSTEQRLAADLSPEGLPAALRRLGAGRNDVGDDLEALRAAGLTDEEIREAFGATAKGKSAWFKRIDHGETLGRIAVSDPTIPSTAFGNALSMVEKWCHG
jgi:putative ATP-dependent endonuclease of the OLD family